MRLALTAVVAIGCSSSATTSAPPSGSAASTPTTPRPPASLRDRALAINGHVTILKSQATFAEYRDVVRSAMQIKGVTSAEPFVFSDMTATSPSATAPVKLVVKGIDPAGVTKAAISSFLRAGTLDLATKSELPPTVVLADGLAASLGARLGDQITITVERTTFDSNWNPQSTPHPQMVRVGGIIHTEIDEYDHHLAYVALATLQDMLDRGDTVMGIEIRVHDIDRAAAIAGELDKTLGGPPYEARDWHSLNPDL